MKYVKGKIQIHRQVTGKEKSKVKDVENTLRKFKIPLTGFREREE